MSSSAFSFLAGFSSAPPSRDNQRKYCDYEPPQELIDSWVRRSDNQIMGLEILSIALGAVLTFHEMRLQQMLPQAFQHLPRTLLAGTW